MDCIRAGAGITVLGLGEQINLYYNKLISMRECDLPISCEKLLQAMVGFDTVNSNISGVIDAELALSKYLEDLARDMGLATQRLPVSREGFNLLVSHEMAAEAPWLLFESHLDTVSVEGTDLCRRAIAGATLAAYRSSSRRANTAITGGCAQWGSALVDTC